MDWFLWRCVCNEGGCDTSEGLCHPISDLNGTHHFAEFGEHVAGLSEWSTVEQARWKGLVTYTADLTQDLIGPPLRVGQVWYLLPGEKQSLEFATLMLHCNGVQVTPSNGKPATSVALSPFSLVQACRLHSNDADVAAASMRLFKLSIFQHGSTHYFATQGSDADAMRARWVADISQALRVLTQSLFPEFSLRVDPVPGAAWTSTRLLAGFLIVCVEHGVSLVFCELHSHWDSAAQFVCYEDDSCENEYINLSIEMDTSISERVGVDDSCFSFAGYNFSARSRTEKMLWLRAISNVKVKLRHSINNPTFEELNMYRQAIREFTKNALGSEGGTPWPERTFTQQALLPRRISPLDTEQHGRHLGPVMGKVLAGSQPVSVNDLQKGRESSSFAMQRDSDGFAAQFANWQSEQSTHSFPPVDIPLLHGNVGPLKPASGVVAIPHKLAAVGLPISLPPLGTDSEVTTAPQLEHVPGSALVGTIDKVVVCSKNRASATKQVS
eukprot:TRINITY_DN57048_c0_g1_i1.p1 TRINITY_DN57048_c0_g1~~TRINITY_DN57048_c0_g1_i1.p1  ORF type:complete len:497 (-),score=56.77 TRINITY_DN57048_c0_g1_i1:45-1535(-)